MTILCGIYQIKNIINNKSYIGQSTDINKRIAKHKASLRHNKHNNSHLQNAYNKYGEDKFVFKQSMVFLLKQPEWTKTFTI